MKRNADVGDTFKYFFYKLVLLTSCCPDTMGPRSNYVIALQVRGLRFSGILLNLVPFSAALESLSKLCYAESREVADVSPWKGQSCCEIWRFMHFGGFVLYYFLIKCALLLSTGSGEWIRKIVFEKGSCVLWIIIWITIRFMLLKLFGKKKMISYNFNVHSSRSFHEKKYRIRGRKNHNMTLGNHNFITIEICNWSSKILNEKIWNWSSKIWKEKFWNWWSNIWKDKLLVKVHRQTWDSTAHFIRFDADPKLYKQINEKILLCYRYKECFQQDFNLTSTGIRANVLKVNFLGQLLL